MFPLTEKSTPGQEGAGWYFKYRWVAISMRPLQKVTARSKPTTLNRNKPNPKNLELAQVKTKSGTKIDLAQNQCQTDLSEILCGREQARALY